MFNINRLAMKNERLAFLLFVITTFGLTSCTLDEPGPALPSGEYMECVNLPDPPFFDGWNTIYPKYYDRVISLNPDNPNDILHARTTIGFPTDSIFRLNLASRSRQYLFSLGNVKSIEWGRNGWVVVDGPGIWKVRPDGTELSMIDLPGGGSWPVFNPAGDRIAVQQANFDHNVSVVDLDGNVIQTLDIIGVRDWFTEDSMLVYNWMPDIENYGIFFFDIRTNEKTLITPMPRDDFEPLNFINQLRMFPDHDRIAVLTGNGLWVISSKSKSINRLAWKCDNHFVWDVQVHPNGQVLFIEEYSNRQVDSITVKQSIRVLRMNAETGERWNTILESQ